MEPSGRNRRQPVAKQQPRKRLKWATAVAVGCDQLLEAFHGKEGSPLESPIGLRLREGAAIAIYRVRSLLALATKVAPRRARRLRLSALTS